MIFTTEHLFAALTIAGIFAVVISDILAGNRRE
jgi:hypothetical protein